MGILISILAWDAARFGAEARPADVRAAYKLGIQVAVSARDLDAIKAGQIPVPLSDRRAGDASSFIWSRAFLERPGDCLTAKQGQLADRDCEQADTLTRSANRLVISRLQNGANQIGVHTTPLTAGQTEAFGAVYGAEGEIGIGRDFRAASRFKIEIEEGPVQSPARVGADPDDETADGEGNCAAPRIVRSTTPLVASFLPGALTRPCTFVSADRRRLVLLQLQHSMLQRSLAARTLQCKALLKTVIDAAHIPDFAGCLSANWNEPVAPTATLVLFQSLGSGEWAFIK
jgi:hypothetical protein